MGMQTETTLKDAYSLIEECKFQQAFEILNRALTADLENDNLVYAIKCCNFWQKVMDKLTELGYFERGEYLLSEWKRFYQSEQSENFIEDEQKKIFYAFRKGVFSLALEFYLKANDEKDSRLRAEIYRKQGICYKKLGSYEQALKLLSMANAETPNCAAIMAEMADSYALCSETKKAKLLFREAFYVDPQKIDLLFLDSELIHLLISKVKETYKDSGDILEWIPVYGVLYSVLNIKRTLKSQEVLHLKQEIFTTESEIKDPDCNIKVLKPRLINMYFRLIDHYLLTKDNISKINELMLKIKLRDPEVYKIYVS